MQGLLGIHPGHDVRNHTKHISANVFANWRADACEAGMVHFAASTGNELIALAR